MKNQAKTIHLQYYAVLREQRGCHEETIETFASTPSELYKELQKKYKLSLSENILRIAINDEFKDWNTLLRAGDSVVFIPPVAGG